MSCDFIGPLKTVNSFRKDDAHSNRHDSLKEDDSVDKGDYNDHTPFSIMLDGYSTACKCPEENYEMTNNSL